MNAVIVSKTYPAPPFCEREILRYAGCRSADDGVAALLDSCIREVRDKLSYRVCYGEFPVTVTGDSCDLGAFAVRSTRLAANLAGCSSALVFAATVGVEIDRLIAKYGRLSPSRALVLQAIGAERIEALCDAFCADVADGRCPKPRFSPGYGDLPLTVQREVFAVLDCSKRIGLSLNDSLLMSPSKSVTAFVGLSCHKENQPQNTCSACDKQDCQFRSVV